MGRVNQALHVPCQREAEDPSFPSRTRAFTLIDYAGGIQERLWKHESPSRSNKQTRYVAQARSNPHHVVRADATATTRFPQLRSPHRGLQQAAGSRLKWLREMKVAQALYEQAISTMHTDSVALSDYCLQARQWLQQHDPKMCQSGGYPEK